MRKLTKREKVLIYIMVFVLLVAGMVLLLIRPLSETLSSGEESLSFLRTEQAGMEQTIGQLTELETQVEAERSALNQSAAGLYAPMTSEELDRLVTGMVREEGLSPESLTIDGQVYDRVTPWLSDSQVDSGEEEEDTARGALWIYRVSTVAAGTLAQAQSLIDRADGDDAMRVTDFTIQRDENALAGETDVVKVYLAVEIYACSLDGLGLTE